MQKPGAHQGQKKKKKKKKNEEAVIEFLVAGVTLLLGIVRKGGFKYSL